jgi:hypothetical protein
MHVDFELHTAGHWIFDRGTCVSDATVVQVGVLVVGATFMSSSGWDRADYGTAMYSRSERDGQGNPFLLVVNPASPTALPPETLEKIMVAFSI